MEMLLLKRYTIPSFHIGRYLNKDTFCFYIIQYFPVAFVTNATRNRTIFDTDAIFIVECFYKRDRSVKV